MPLGSFSNDGDAYPMSDMMMRTYILTIALHILYYTMHYYSITSHGRRSLLKPHAYYFTNDRRSV
jgi:hypothetical protein